MSWELKSEVARPDAVPVSQDPALSRQRRALQSHWTRLARSLPRRARVLEVGAGSCLVSRWMATARPDLQIVATDCGDYPLAAAGMEKIRFLARTPMEALPLEDAAFDAVVSQFGFEYADRTQALCECVRVLGPRGRLSLLMHVADGMVHRGCSLRVDGARMILDAPSLFDVFRRAAGIRDAGLRASAMDTVALPEAMRKLGRLEDMERSAGLKAQGLRDFLQTAMRLAHGPTFLTWLGSAERQFDTDLFIATQQTEAALDADDIDELSSGAVRLGLRCDPVEAPAIGWKWSAAKAG